MKKKQYLMKSTHTSVLCGRGLSTTVVLCDSPRSHELTLARKFSFMAKNLDAVLQSIDSFKSDISASLAKIEERLAKVENLPQNGANIEDVGQHDQQLVDSRSFVSSGKRLQRDNRALPSTDYSHLGGEDADSLLHRYKGVRDSFSSVRLPDNLYFGGRQTGLDAKVRDSAALLNNSARYTETALKAVSSLYDQVVGQLDADINLDSVRWLTEDLSVCLVAQMRFMQEEQAGLVVASTYGPRAKMLFKTLGSSSTGFGDPKLVRCMETAANLASLAAKEDSSQRGQGSWRGPGRGHGGFGQRGGFQKRFNRDYNPGFNPANLPAEREESQ